jgi:hypothetical protein
MTSSRIEEHLTGYLAYLLALRGAPLDAICQIITNRFEEYSSCRAIMADKDEPPAGTVLWDGPAHLMEALGMPKNVIFSLAWQKGFLKCLTHAQIGEILSKSASVRARSRL